MERNTDHKLIAGLLALTLLIGGAGASFPRIEMLLAICAIALAAYFMLSRRSWRFPRLTALALWVLMLSLLLPVLQLVPLPPDIWQRLPGRQLAIETDAALGWSRWRPLTLDIEGTIRSLLALLPAAAIFIGCIFLPWKARCQLLWIILAGAVLTVLLGIAQLASGGSFTPFASGHLGYPVGLFVNRNHNAALLLVAMLIAASLGGMQIARGGPRVPWVIASLSAIATFAIVAVGTTSRMALILLPVALAGSFLLLFYRQSTSRLLLSSAVILSAVGSLLFASTGLDRAVARFTGFADPRFNYWTDIRWALETYGLAGTGFGTFVPVHKSAESLEAVVPQTTNHAHNDYLEILLEGGLPAVILFVLFIAVLVMVSVQMFRTRLRLEQVLALGAAAGGIALLLAWSFVDYPLRMASLSAVFAVLFSILLPTGISPRSTADAGDPSGRRSQTKPGARSRWDLARVAMSLPILAVLLIVSFQAGMAAHHMGNDRPREALKWAPWSTRANDQISTQTLLRNDPENALPPAFSAIRLSPISAPAIRSVGLARLGAGDVAGGHRLMQAAVSLGWRDPLTQLWAIQAARSSREPEKALQRAEALFRQEALVMPATILLLSGPPDSPVIPQLAQKLEQRPVWRSAFFEAGKTLPIEQADNWVRLVGLLARTRAPVTPEEGQPSLDSLVARGATDQAQQLWKIMRGRDLVRNGDFESIRQREEKTLPTDWHAPRKAHDRIAVARPDFDPKTQALHARGAGDGVILSQTLMLEPGRYNLAFRMRSSAGRAETLRWELVCESSGIVQAREVKASWAGWQRTTLTLTVPNQHCAIQRLALRTPDAHNSFDIWIDDITLDRIAN